MSVPTPAENQVYEKTADTLVYALRIRGDRFQPGVFSEGEYTVRVGDPDADRWESLTVKASTDKDLPRLELF